MARTSSWLLLLASSAALGACADAPSGALSPEFQAHTDATLAEAAGGKGRGRWKTREVLVTPDAVSLAPGASQRFSVYVKDKDGSVDSAPVRFSATGGTIDSTGLYTAGPESGRFAVVVTVAGTSLSDTAAATIVGSDDPGQDDPEGPGEPDAPEADTSVAAVAVTLGAGTLSIGATTDVDVTYYNSQGDQLEGKPVVLSSSNPAIASISGRTLTAVSAGSATIAASVDGRSGSAVVQVEGSALDGVPIWPGDDIQAKVSAAAAGTRFVLKAGTHRRQTILPKDGMSFVGEPGAVLDGENATAYAIGTPSHRSRGVVVRGLVVQRYAPPETWAGAIGNDGAIEWLVEGNEIRDNATAGIRVGAGTRVVNNRIHGNAIMGVSGYRAHGAVIEGNAVSGNGFTRDTSGATATRAGMKIVGSEHVTIRNNHVHDNMSYGIWCDIDCRYALIEGNRVVGNTKAGIFYEISYDAVIRNNHVEGNHPGGSSWVTAAGILISGSANVEVYGNTVLDNGDGIIAFQMPRGSGRYGPWEVSNLYVHDNTIRMLRGHTGLAQKEGDRSYFTSRNNRFERNAYTLGSNSGYFTWNDEYTRTEAQWRSYGQDVNGTFSR